MTFDIIRRSISLLFLFMLIMFFVGYSLGKEEVEIKYEKKELLQLFTEWLKENKL